MSDGGASIKNEGGFQMKLWTEEEQEKYLKEFAPAVAVAPAEPLPVTEPKSATFMERADYGVSIGAPIIPLNPRLKTPWSVLGVNSKTTDWELIAKWNRQEPTLNCGIVAVHELGGKWFLDDDLGTLEETIQNETVISWLVSTASVRAVDRIIISNTTKAR